MTNNLKSDVFTQVTQVPASVIDAQVDQINPDLRLREDLGFMGDDVDDLLA